MFKRGDWVYLYRRPVVGWKYGYGKGKERALKEQTPLEIGNINPNSEYREPHAVTHDKNYNTYTVPLSCIKHLRSKKLTVILDE